MNKQEFIQKMKTEMPDGLDKIETARYIYIQLGKEKSFDEKYFFGNKKTKNQIYRLAEGTRFDTNKVARNKKIICVSLSYLYRDILDEFGINVIIAEEMDHKYPIICLPDGKLIKADLQLDLYNIQTNSKTENFGTRTKYESYNVYGLSPEQIYEIDKKVGYINDKKDYKDNEIERIKELVKGKNATESLEIIMQDKKLSQINENIEYVELYKYYKKIFYATINRYMYRKVFPIACYREDENGERNYTMCVYSSDKDDVKAYMFSRKEKQFIQIGLLKIKDLINQGLVMGTRDNVPGVKKLRKIIEEETKEFMSK